MTKVLVGNLGSYTFDASAQTITLSGLPTLDIEQLLLITNVKNNNNQVIYQFDLPAKSGTIAANTITLAFDTTLMNDTDPLQIWIDVASSEAETFSKIKGSTSGNIAEVTASNALKVDASAAPAALFKIQDATITANVAQVTSSGELKTVNPPPIAPVGTDPIRIVQRSTATTSDFFTVIANTKTMVLQRLSGGSEYSASGAIVELFYAPNGNTTGLEIIEDIYVQGNSGQKDLNQSFVGNGTRAILLRRRVFSGGAVLITGRWEGYEE